MSTLAGAGVHAYASGAHAVGCRFDIPSGFVVIIRYLFFVLTKTDGMLLKHAVRHYRDKVMFDCRPLLIRDDFFHF